MIIKKTVIFCKNMFYIFLYWFIYINMYIIVSLNFKLLWYYNMKEVLNPTEEKNIDSVSLEKFQAMEDVLNICDGFYSNLTDLIMIRDESVEKGENSLRRKLKWFGNKYQKILNFHKEKNYETKKNFDECYASVQNFLVELGGILADLIEKTKKGENQLVDEFVEKMFELNDAFCELNRTIDSHENAAYHVSLGLNWDSDYNVNYDTLEMYNAVFGKYRLQKNMNKCLWINVYRPLLELVDKELEALLGKSWEESKPLSEKDFREVSNDLFIMDYLNIRSYKDFCKKYNVLKDKQRTLSKLKQKIDKRFDEKWNSKSEVDVEGLHMNDLQLFLKVNFMDLATQAISKVFEKKKKHD